MVHDTLQQREQTPREFTSAMRQGVPLVLESKGDLVPWKYYAEIIPVKYTGKRPEAGRVLNAAQEQRRSGAPTRLNARPGGAVTMNMQKKSVIRAEWKPVRVSQTSNVA